MAGKLGFWCRLGVLTSTAALALIELTRRWRKLSAERRQGKEQLQAWEAEGGSLGKSAPDKAAT